MLIGADDAGDMCDRSALFAFDARSGRVDRSLRLVPDCGSPEDTGKTPDSSPANTRAVGLAQGVLDGLSLRQFDGGDVEETSDPWGEKNELVMPGVTLTFERQQRGDDRWLASIRGRTPAGPLFVKDVSAWKNERDRGGHGATLVGPQVVRVDVASRTLLFVGAYQNTNAFLTARQTIHVAHF